MSSVRLVFLQKFRTILAAGGFALVLVLVLVLPLARAAGNPPAASPPDAALLQRAEKIVAPIVAGDPVQAARVRDIVAQQYTDLRRIHEARAGAFAVARRNSEPTAAALAVTAAQDQALARQAELHFAFLGRLAGELTPAQIDAVKDGMTYGVVPLTERVYGEMLPNLTPEQRKQIRAWLVEAREHAMDAGSSDEKHAWFGKYKGKINNFLAAAGINLKQAEKDLAARRKSAGRSGAR